jgi:hypothetical protein
VNVYWLHAGCRLTVGGAIGGLFRRSMTGFWTRNGRAPVLFKGPSEVQILQPPASVPVGCRNSERAANLLIDRGWNLRNFSESALIDQGSLVALQTAP